MEIFDIRNKIEVGKQIFEIVPNDLRPGWAGLILSKFDNYIVPIPIEVSDIYQIINDQERWGEAHNQFTKIRQFNLKNKDYKPESYLLLAEMVAKVTYNSSGLPAPFDHDNGWYIPSLALKSAQYFKEADIEEKVMSAILFKPQ